LAPIDPSFRGRGTAALALVVALACGSGEPTPTDPGGGPGEPPTPAPPSPTQLVLASGELALPGAAQEGDPGSHEVLIAGHLVRSDLPATSGKLLILTLRDATRPALACASEDPEDGCATIDWSDDPDRPRVPPDGAFENRLDLELVSGVRRLYLSRTLRLNGVPDLVDPLREHTAVGGSGQEWHLILPAALEPETRLDLRLIMTKWQAPDVRIAYEVRVVESGAAG